MNLPGSVGRQSEQPIQSLHNASTQDWSLTSTDWSIVHLAQSGDGSALDRLYRKHFYPIFAYFRKHGEAADDARDLTQELFAQLIQKEGLGRPNEAKGRLRTWLLSIASRVRIDEWRRQHTQFRGGNMQTISLDEADLEAVDSAVTIGGTPDQVFDLMWAQGVWERSLKRLQAEFEGAGKVNLFQVLQQGLVPDSRVTIASLAEKLRSNENTTTVALHRFRRRFGEIVSEEILQTLENPADLGEELRYLCSVLAQSG